MMCSLVRVVFAARASGDDPAKDAGHAIADYKLKPNHPSTLTTVIVEHMF
jgi:hypothetical protein